MARSRILLLVCLMMVCKSTLPCSISVSYTHLMERTLTNYTMNPLYIYLVGILGKDETKRIFHLYRVGTSKNGAALLSTGRLIGKATCEPER